MPNIYRNIRLIYNPVAGKLQRASGSPIEDVRDILQAAGHGVTLAPTGAPRDAHRLARRAAEEDVDLVLVAGGDGTINEAVNGLVHTKTPMAVLPAGTANVLATELGLARTPEQAAEQLGELKPERVSAGFLQTTERNSRYFLMMAGIGLDASIVVNVDLELKKRLGKLAYWIGGLGRLGHKLPEFEVQVGASRLRSSFTLASRVRNYGGDLEIAKTACLLDDHFEVVVFQGEDSFQYLKYLTGVLANLLDTMEGVSVVKAREIELARVNGADIDVHVDGELIGTLPATIEIVPDALTLLMPGEFRKKYAGCPDAPSPDN